VKKADPLPARPFWCRGFRWVHRPTEYPAEWPVPVQSRRVAVLRPTADEENALRGD